MMQEKKIYHLVLRMLRKKRLMKWQKTTFGVDYNRTKNEGI